MRLRTLAGAYAGEIRNYLHHVGLAALRAGTAERVDVAPTRPAAEKTKTTPATRAGARKK